MSQNSSEINTKNETLLLAFTEWLDLMGYAKSSVYAHPRAVQHLMTFLKGKQISLQGADAQVVSAFFIHLKERENIRRAGKLSASYLNKILQSLKLFSRFLRESELGSLPIEQRQFQRERTTTPILSQSAIHQLYDVLSGTPQGLRDRAILAVFYGCGLRRSEGVALDLSDVLDRQGLLYVRHGKGSRERYVPMSAGVISDLMLWLEKGRPSYPSESEALLLSARGERLSGQMMALRLKKLCQAAEIEAVGLHSLRHSIATHLLQAGMKLEEVGTFLGHSSLASTQIYTHIHEELR